MKTSIQNSKFYNKNGDLTRYSFLCGYVQKKEIEIDGKTFYKELYMEHRCYHVQCGIRGQRYSIWETFDDELTKARKYYNSLNPKSIKL